MRDAATQKVLLRNANSASMHPTIETPPVSWLVSAAPIDYAHALLQMEQRVEHIIKNQAPETLWLLEHTALYTAGASAKEHDLLDARFPLHRIRRGGQLTYHGPGQRIAYVMLNLSHRQRDVRAFVYHLEDWVIATLADFGVQGLRHPSRVGVWVRRPDKAPGALGEVAEDKIAAIGVQLRHWVSFHGLALNVATDLSHYSGINPCGVKEKHLGVTSLRDLGIDADLASIDDSLRKNFIKLFGPTKAHELIENDLI